MAGVSRYSFTSFCKDHGLTPDPKGDWVKYTELKAVVQQAYQDGKKEGMRVTIGPPIILESASRSN